MASVPPLLCISNTPPPIDFGDAEDSDIPTLHDDDEFGDDIKDIKVEKLNSSFDSEFTDHLQSGFEDVNVFVNSSPPLSPKTVFPHSIIECGANNANALEDPLSHERVDESEERGKCTDMKALSEMINQDEFADPCTENVDISNCKDINLGDRTKTKEEFCENSIGEDQGASLFASEIPHIDFKNNFIIEDIIDDSSDEESQSYKKKEMLEPNENSEDFFAIHIINQDEDSDIKSERLPANYEESNNINCPKEDHLRHEINQAGSSEAECKPLSGVSETHYQDIESMPMKSKAECSKSEAEIKIEIVSNVNTNSDEDDEQDKFDDFQDFSSASVENTVENSKEQNSNLSFPTNVNDAIVINDDANDDDDFGDFSEASFASPNYESQLSLPATNNSNLSRHIQPVLDVMFPVISESNYPVNAYLKDIPNIMQLKAIESAKALDYQWTKSEVRCALLKSVGVDSRNVLFGDTWSSTMPRYAANLSFNPLLPLKPEAGATNSDDVNGANVEQTDRGAEGGGSVAKADIPTMQFAWNNANLGSPLDGFKDDAHAREVEAVHMSQFEKHCSANDDEQQPPNSADSPEHCTTSFDTSTEAPAITPGAAGAEVSATFPSGIISHSINKTVNQNDAQHEQLNVAEQFMLPNSLCFGSNLVENPTEIAFNSEENSNGNNTVISLQTNKNDDEVITTSTYAGPLKETHIYTPSKGDVVAAKLSRPAFAASATKAGPIDFDYEIAAAGIIIDETVVKKEYRDVEYNPGFELDLNRFRNTEFGNKPNAVMDLQISTSECNTQLKNVEVLKNQKDDDCDDEFSEFQSVPATSNVADNNTSPLNRNSRIAPPLGGEMILSPAILLPQAISIDTSSTFIEWGDVTNDINAEELARIEELFPQPQIKSRETDVNTLQTPKNTPKIVPNVQSNSLSISATIAEKEKRNVDDDDDWSDFISVPATSVNATPSNANNNRLSQTIPEIQQRPITQLASTNDDENEWCDFVSSIPSSQQSELQLRGPQQFNSGAWQNANYYNNPLSFYHKQHIQGVAKSNSIGFQNNNNHYNHMDFQPQKIHVMQDYSMTPSYRPQITQTSNSSAHSSQLQVGSAKVAPSISLIPDLGFVAPPGPAHTTFINSLPKPSFSMKK